MDGSGGFAEVTLVVDKSVRGLCCRPYPGHPKGCPNFGEKLGCPPQCPLVDQVFDLSKPVWFIWNVFDMKSHLCKMEIWHPGWSDRQKRCCLYWQGGARSKLRDWIDVFIYNHPGLYVSTCPEAMGVNVTGTMWTSLGKGLQWPPRTVAYQVAIAGTRLLSQGIQDSLPTGLETA